MVSGKLTAWVFLAAMFGFCALGANGQAIALVLLSALAIRVGILSLYAQQARADLQEKIRNK